MDCRASLRMLEVCRPSGEDWSDAELHDAIAHVDQCPNCLGHVRGRQALDSRLAAAMQDVPIPPDLHGRIHARLAACPTPPRRSFKRGVLWAACLGTVAAVVCVAATAYFWPRTVQSPLDVGWNELG